MDSNSIVIISSLIAAMGGKEAWGYYRRRAILKSQEAMKDKELSSHGDVIIKKELRELLDRQIEELKAEVIRVHLAKGVIEKEHNELTVKCAILTERLLSYTQHSRGNKDKINKK